MLLEQWQAWSLSLSWGPCSSAWPMKNFSLIPDLNFQWYICKPFPCDITPNTRGEISITFSAPCHEKVVDSNEVSPQSPWGWTKLLSSATHAPLSIFLLLSFGHILLFLYPSFRSRKLHTVLEMRLHQCLQLDNPFNQSGILCLMPPRIRLALLASRTNWLLTHIELTIN